MTGDNKHLLREVAGHVKNTLEALYVDKWQTAIREVDLANDLMGEVGPKVMNLDPTLIADVDQLNGELWEHNLGVQRTTVMRTIEHGEDVLRRLQNIDSDGLRNYYVTFGQKYRQNPHPTSINGERPHPDATVLIRCGNRTIADATAHALFGTKYAFVYSEENHDSSLYQRGTIALITIGE